VSVRVAELAGSGRKTKRFRVAREGQTVDGRVLSRQDVIEMAATYNMDEYGARINVEHISGYSPLPPFNAYGDILLVDAVEENGRFCLYNTISALPNMQEILSLGQKIYPSIEFIRDFAGSGKAYQVGLGLTDTPASLGTQAIKFNALTPHGHVVRTAPDQELFIMSQTTPPAAQTFASKISTLLSGMIGTATHNSQPPQPITPPAQPVQIDQFQAASYQAFQQIFTNQNQLAQAIQALSTELQGRTPPASATPTADILSQQPVVTPPANTVQPPAVLPAAPVVQQNSQPATATMEQLMAQMLAGQQTLTQTIQQLSVTPQGVPPLNNGGVLGMANEF
jgi:hypothetical protein